MAIDSCQIGELVTVRLLQQQLLAKTHSIKEARAVFSPLTSYILTCVSPLIKVDKSLAANLLIRWKCLYSELHAVLIRLGIGPMYLKVYQDLQQLLVNNTCTSDKIMTIHDQLKTSIKDFTTIYGVLALTVLPKQLCDEVQIILEDSTVVFEYCFLEHIDGEKNGTLLVIFPENEPMVIHLDLHEVFSKSREWVKALNNPKVQDEAVAISRALCDKLVPEPVAQACRNRHIKKIYICPDNVLGILPLELLLFSDNETLDEKYFISYLSSARELLREYVIKAVNKTSAEHLHAQADDNVDTTPSESQGEMKQPTESEEHDSDLLEPETKEKEPQIPIVSKHPTQQCAIIAAPNYNLHQAQHESVMSTIINAFGFLLSDSAYPQEEIIQPLPSSLKEAGIVRTILSGRSFEVTELVNDTATAANVIRLQSPKILHISTHGFSKPDPEDLYGSFWSDTKAGICLAGVNTYIQKKFDSIVPETGTGTLNSLAVSGMRLEGTGLVFLSTCSSSYGQYGYSQSVRSLAQAFRAAGAKTVIASLWQVVDVTTVPFVTYFYESLCRTGTCPSEALAYSKEILREETSYDHFIYWSSFICIGEDKPLF